VHTCGSFSGLTFAVVASCTETSPALPSGIAAAGVALSGKVRASAAIVSARNADARLMANRLTRDPACQMGLTINQRPRAVGLICVVGLVWV
jgi:hypothetical protein